MNIIKRIFQLYTSNKNSSENNQENLELSRLIDFEASLDQKMNSVEGSINELIHTSNLLDHKIGNTLKRKDDLLVKTLLKDKKNIQLQIEDYKSFLHGLLKKKQKLKEGIHKLRIRQHDIEVNKQWVGVESTSDFITTSNESELLDVADDVIDTQDLESTFHNEKNKLEQSVKDRQHKKVLKTLNSFFKEENKKPNNINKRKRVNHFLEKVNYRNQIIEKFSSHESKALENSAIPKEEIQKRVFTSSVSRFFKK